MAWVRVTGGAEYIGSHTCAELSRAGHEVAIVDNLSDSSAIVLGRRRELTAADVVWQQSNPDGHA